MALLINKLLICVLVSAVIAFSALGWQAGEGAAVSSGELIRFHVIANSDSPLDQSLKLKVRDEVIRTMAPVLAGAGDIEEARRLTDENVDMITRASTGVLSKYGCDYPVKVERGIYGFPEKTYTIRRGEEGGTAEMRLPAGDYEAVRIVIGSGRGSNWWCVLFPPLCFVSPVEAGDRGKETPGRGEGVEDGGIPAFKRQRINPEMAEAAPVIEYRFKAAEWLNMIKSGKFN